MDYSFVEAQDTHLKFGIIWFSDEGDEIGTDWYDSEEERLNAIDVWYAETQDPNLEQ